MVQRFPVAVVWHTTTPRGRTAAHRSEYAGYAPYGSAAGLCPARPPTWRPFRHRPYRFLPAPRATVPGGRSLSAADTPAAGSPVPPRGNGYGNATASAPGQRPDAVPPETECGQSDATVRQSDTPRMPSRSLSLMHDRASVTAGPALASSNNLAMNAATTTPTDAIQRGKRGWLC